MSDPSPAAQTVCLRMAQLEHRRDVLNAALDREMARLQQLLHYELSWSES